MARATVDRSRPFAEISGPGRTHAFEQDGKYFDAEGVEITRSEMLDKLQAAAPSAADQAIADLNRAVTEKDARIAELTKEKDNLTNLLEQANKDGNTARVAELEGQVAEKQKALDEANQTIADQKKELDESFEALKAAAETGQTRTENPGEQPAPAETPASGETAPISDSPPATPESSPAGETQDSTPAAEPAGESTPETPTEPQQ